MRIRGSYEITQTDRTLQDDDLRTKAQEEIVRQLIEAFVKNFGDKMVREEPGQRYEFGRFLIDIDVEAVQ